ncbi:MAG: hypothetical protein GXO10_00615 [Crenarchaeota archaeon]|nr:hypothetical protein [Thermoproteota archaeon]
MGKRISKLVETIVERSLMNKIILYLDDDDERREKVLKASVDILNKIDVPAAYIDASNIVKTCLLAGKNMIEDLNNISARVVAIDSFDTMLVVEKLKDSATRFLKKMLEKGSTLILASGTDVLNDSEILNRISSLGPVHVINAVAQESKTRKKIYTSLRTVIKRFLGDGYEDSENNEDYIVVE